MGSAIGVNDDGDGGVDVLSELIDGMDVPAGVNGGVGGAW